LRPCSRLIDNEGTSELRTWFELEIAAFHAQNRRLADADGGGEDLRGQAEPLGGSDHGFGDDGTGFRAGESGHWRLLYHENEVGAVDEFARRVF
jgi:hypothetical protein